MSTITTARPQLFSGNLRPFPGIPEDWSAAKKEAAEFILMDVRAAFPEMLSEIDPDDDIEDFWEDAARISAAWQASGKNLAAKAPGTPQNPWTEDEMARRFGPVTIVEDGGHHGLDHLIGHPLVMKHGGRRVLLGSIGGNWHQDIVKWLARRHRDAGVTHGVVKAVANKAGIWSIELDSDPIVVGQRLFEAMDWEYIRLEEIANTLLAQDALDLQYEYRLFVVDGELVSGAGCVEEFTPLDRRHDNTGFDTRVRRVRGHLHQGKPSPVEDQPEIVERLLEFGRKMAKEFGGTVVIDVALDAIRDVPVVIELNGMSNSGLYASDPWHVARKLASAADRGYLV